MQSPIWSSSLATRRSMQANSRRDTVPEIRLRSALHRLGLRFRIDARPLPHVNRRADIVFRPAKVAVYVHGCFWHGCPEHGTQPKRNSEYWTEKIERNRKRDLETENKLRESGWLPVTIWEHEDSEAAAERIRQLVISRRCRGGYPS